ncbi:thioredoxin fold domain-containing protein [Agaribacterium haliotis]|uniref:thioredoxin fold domain-containing protein n=1 Tax=Agaribacterium haliotis TaxID=2013869 RepID=UPI001304408A|nr:thioredoxin fold domain-containing protein [Agaribacterium haliotis]
MQGLSCACKKLIVVLSCALAGFSFTAEASAKQAVGIKMSSLYGGKKTTVAEHNLPSIVLAFQPNCRWCTKQGQDLSLLQQQCGDLLNLSLLGVKAKRSALKHELQHFDKNLPALEANSKFLKKVRGVQATPSLFFFDADGNLISKRRGYLQAKRLFAAASLLIEEQRGETDACQLPAQSSAGQPAAGER